MRQGSIGTLTTVLFKVVKRKYPLLFGLLGELNVQFLSAI